MLSEGSQVQKDKSIMFSPRSRKRKMEPENIIVMVERSEVSTGRWERMTENYIEIYCICV
jgi:hypothetical protein